MIEIKIPSVGESITEVTLIKWLKPSGSWVERDEVLCELESEKATFELSAEQAGTFKPVAKDGDVLNIGDLACQIDETATRPESVLPIVEISKPNEVKAEVAPADKAESKQVNLFESVKATPVAANIIEDKKVPVSNIAPTGSNGKITKGDVLAAMAKPGSIKSEASSISRVDKPEKMSNLRKTISKRLVEAKNTTAMLTTFNEVDMSSIMALRNQYKDKFKESHGVGLGFMSFFTKACSIALMEWPAVNAYIDGDQIIYHEYCDISIAVSAPKGLVVPVIRNAEQLSFAGVEAEVAALAAKARENKLSIEEMTGGTFTITNGGVFGSLMSTPIINLPQSAILGMHKIQDRPMAINGRVEIKPMMYLALSYDHRIIDGRESVGFLVRVKELLENPLLMITGSDPGKILLGL
jgi:2-oxoglutarate dehydrogenase E2 component (dihydrolipoamide succinyltransferase)